MPAKHSINSAGSTKACVNRVRRMRISHKSLSPTLQRLS